MPIQGASPLARIARIFLGSARLARSQVAALARARARAAIDRGVTADGFIARFMGSRTNGAAGFVRNVRLSCNAWGETQIALLDIPYYYREIFRTSSHLES